MRISRFDVGALLPISSIAMLFGLILGGVSGAATIMRPVTGQAIHTQSNPPWTQTVLFDFNAYANGWSPSGGVIADTHGALYGVTSGGGLGYGVVYRLAPSSTGWTQTVLHAFNGTDGAAPAGNLAMDAAGNLYGAATQGGSFGGGVMFELSPSSTGWAYKILHTFAGNAVNPNDGYQPNAPILIGGVLYGTTYMGGYYGPGPCDEAFSVGCGTVFSLTPTASGGWQYSVIYAFYHDQVNDGFGPAAGLATDGLGNLYGVTQESIFSNAGSWGTVFRLNPPFGGRTTWSESILYVFSGSAYSPNPSSDGALPNTTLSWFHGSLFGTTVFGGPSGTTGTIFQLNRWSGTWTETQIYAFPTTAPNIANPGPLLADNSGNLYCPSAGTLSRFYWVANSSGSGGTWVQRQVYPFFNGFSHGGPPLGLIEDSQGNLYGVSNGGAYQHGVIYRLNI